MLSAVLLLEYLCLAAFADVHAALPACALLWPIEQFPHAAIFAY